MKHPGWFSVALSIVIIVAMIGFLKFIGEPVA